MPFTAQDEGNYLRGIKESDLLILSTEDLLQGKHVDDLKRLITPDWLKSTLLRAQSMFAFVVERVRRGTIYLEVKVDISKSNFLQRTSEGSGFIKMYCY